MEVLDNGLACPLPEREIEGEGHYIGEVFVDQDGGGGDSAAAAAAGPVRHGRGRMVYANGDAYSGDWLLVSRAAKARCSMQTAGGTRVAGSRASSMARACAGEDAVCVYVVGPQRERSSSGCLHTP